ncbi:hypothetical protein L226DRAFT_560999 [Lentinus tigrinus ALCF2SS1-7]|uniref:Uncharacterized protein n=1 Tax=Lentinus tigrinus ALCF2SS1-6 TaxID=1328759 RepID=A0A5C2RYQ1_9APHY|nr:hypothetical protein L227DRAFT_287861 [Lentinus tigrinus ALCF2SS1-6]RPD73968.1 hypothetical protein L226DRAFT_560999 [Lentinus tigrinus ALCF2SS1-7]
MSLDLSLSGLLHPDQVLTPRQAAAWAQQLINHFRSNVITLPAFTLDLHEIPGYVALLETLLEHAGMLEQLLCRMLSFLPGNTVENVIAIIVAVHHQLHLLEAEEPHYILDSLTIITMSEYLADVVSYLDATEGWVRSDDYVRVRRGVDRSIAQMKNSLVSFLARRRDAAADGYASGHSVIDTPEDHYSTDAPDALSPFLSLVNSEQIPATLSWAEADSMVLIRNFRPLLVSHTLPYTNPESYTCRRSPSLSSETSASSGSSTACSDSPRPSLKGKERAQPEYTRSLSPAASDWSTSAEAGFPRRLPPVLGLSSSPEPLDSQEVGPGTRKRSRTDPQYQPPSRPKKRRVSLENHGLCGSPSDCDKHDAVAKRVRPFAERAVPLGKNLSPSIFPSPLPSPSPAPPERSRHASPEPGHDLFPPSVESTPHPHIIIPFDGYDTYEPSIGSAFEGDTATSSSCEVAWDVSTADGSDDHPIITQIDPPHGSGTDDLKARPAYPRNRRCFQGLLQTVKHLFHRRS